MRLMIGFIVLGVLLAGSISFRGVPPMSKAEQLKLAEVSYSEAHRRSVAQVIYYGATGTGKKVTVKCYLCHWEERNENHH